MLVMTDAGLYSYDLFTMFAATGADLAWRIGASVSVGHLRWLPDCSHHALTYAPGLSAARRARLVEQARAGQDIPADLARLVRVVEYTVPDRNPDGDLNGVVTTITGSGKPISAKWHNADARRAIKTNCNTSFATRDSLS